MKSVFLLRSDTNFAKFLSFKVRSNIFNSLMSVSGTLLWNIINSCCNTQTINLVSLRQCLIPITVRRTVDLWRTILPYHFCLYDRLSAKTHLIYM